MGRRLCNGRWVPLVSDRLKRDGGEAEQSPMTEACAEDDRDVVHGCAETTQVLSDADVAAAVSGDEGAFVAVYLDVQPRLRRYALSLVGGEADDVTAEAWLQIMRDLGQFSGGLDAFRAWTARIVRNRAMDLARSRARRAVDPRPVEELPAPPAPDDPETAALDSIATADALELIATLPVDQAEAVLLQTVVGLDGRAAARVLGKTAGAVRIATHRGHKTLAKRLRERDRRQQ